MVVINVIIVFVDSDNKVNQTAWVNGAVISTQADSKHPDCLVAATVVNPFQVPT